MANIFEELMLGNSSVTLSEAKNPKASSLLKESANRRASAGCKKIKANKFRFESRHILEDADAAELNKIDDEFAVDPEESSDDEVVLVIDPELSADEDVPEDAAEDLVGDYVYKCPMCGANYVCGCDAVETEAIEVDEEGVPTECPICGDDSEQILVGEIAPADDPSAGEEGEMEPVDPDDGEDNELPKEDEAEEVEEESEEEVLEDSLKKRPRRSPVTEGNLGNDVDKYQKWVDYDMKHYGKISKRTDSYLKKAGLEVVKDDHGDYEVITNSKTEACKESKACPECGKDPCECKKEESKKLVRETVEYDGFKLWDRVRLKDNPEVIGYISEFSDTFDPDDGKIYVSLVLGDDPDEYNQETMTASIDELERIPYFNESKEVVKESDECPECDDLEDMSLELVEPVVEEGEEKAPAVEVHADKAEFFFDDHKFESLMTQMIRENYKGNNEFHLKKASLKNGKLALEYVVGKDTGTFIAEGFDKKARVMTLKIRDKGAFTESYTRAPSFIVECVRIRNKIIPTSLKYNFTKKVNESYYRVKGTVKKG